LVVHKQAQGAPKRAGYHGLRDRAVITALLGCALRGCQAAALTDGRCSGGFTPDGSAHGTGRRAPARGPANPNW